MGRPALRGYESGMYLYFPGKDKNAHKSSETNQKNFVLSLLGIDRLQISQ
jgi:hypothetical protein